MGREKVVEYYNDRYKGSLSTSQCDTIDELLELDSLNGCITDLLHIVYELKDSDIDTIIEDYEEYDECYHSYEKPIGTLRSEQTTGVALMSYADNCILGDSVGMGKTVEVAGLCNLLKSEADVKGKDFKYMFLTEKNLTSQVRREMIKFTGDYVDLLSNGEYDTVVRYINKTSIEGICHSLVGAHSLIRQSAFISWIEQLSKTKSFPFDLLIVDESSFLGSSTTNVTKSFKLIRKYFKRVVFLNATPFETKLKIFYTQLDLLDNKLLPTKKNFSKEYEIIDYRGMYPRPTGKYKNQASFKRLVGYRYFARTRKDKGAVMEGCNGGVKLSPLSPIQKEWLKKTQMKRLVYDCPTYLDSSIEFSMENVPKLASLDSLLRNECAEADTILIFSYYKEPQKYLAEWLHNKGYSCRILNGDTKNTERYEIIESFKRAEFNILITNVQKGLNFGNCNHCIFYSYDSNPSKMIQFEGRMTRDFNIIDKNIYILCSNGSEYKTLINAVRDKAEATRDFTKTDLSIVMDILLGNEGNE